MEEMKADAPLVRGGLAGVVWCAGWLAAVRCSWLTSPNWDWTWQCVAPALAAALCGLLLSGPRWGLAWLFSIPAGLLAVLCAQSGNALERMLNEAFPGYGRMSAGGGFGVMMVTALYAAVTGFLGPFTAWAASEWRRWRAGNKKKEELES